MIRGIYFFLLIFLITFYPLAPLSMDKNVMLSLMIIVVLSLCLFGVRREKVVSLRGHYLKHSFLFLAGFFIANFQYYIDYILGNIGTDRSEIWITQEVVVKGMILCIIGLICFLLGYTFKNYNTKKLKTITIEEDTQNVRLLEILALICFVLYFYFIHPLYLLGNYGFVDKGTVSTHISYLFRFLIFAIIIQTSRNLIIKNVRITSFIHYVRQYSWITISIVGLYLFSVLISGSRNPLITFSIAIIGSYIFVSKKTFNLVKVLVLLFIGSVFITTLAHIRSQRNVDFKDRFSNIPSIKNPSRPNSFSPSTQELAGSIRCIHYSLSYVPVHEDFMFGRFQFQEAISIIPFFSGLSQLIFHDKPSDRVYLKSKTESYLTKYSGSATFISWIAEGNFPFFGYGTTIVADYYLDFGLVGVIIGMFLVGYFLRYAEIIMYALKLPSLLKQCYSLVILCDCIYINRGTFLLSMQTVFWTYIILLLNKLIVSRKTKDVSNVIKHKELPVSEINF